MLIKFYGVVSELHDLNLEEAEGGLILGTDIMEALRHSVLDPTLMGFDDVFDLVKLIASGDVAIECKD